MHVYSVTEKEFRPYGTIVRGLEVDKLLRTLDATTPAPRDGTVYVADDGGLDKLAVYKVLQDHVYGGLPIQIGYCNGTNSKLNCLEYHRGSEVNVSSSDFILLLATIGDFDGEKLSSSRVKAFKVPKGTAVRIYETTLHYAPCGDQFRVAVVLPKGTNTRRPGWRVAKTDEDPLLWANNKWLIAHAESPEAKQGAHVGIIGRNLDVRKD